MLKAIFIDAKIAVEGNVAATVNNIMANQFLFRIGTAIDLITAPIVVIEFLALYVILKTVSKNLASLALLWRLGEAIILGGAVMLCNLIVLLLINGKGYSTVFETEQLQALVGLFLDAQWAAYSILLVFMGLGSIIFVYLLYKSKYVPRILAAWGIFGYLLALIYAFTYILLPNFGEMISMPVFLAPLALFELTIGLWLLFKGVNTQQKEKSVLESA